MGKYLRSIQVAFDRKSGEVLEADQVFDTPTDAFSVRKQFHRKEVELYCCECDQKLNVSGSKYDRLHFKHEPGHDFCLLSAGSMSAEEHEAFSGVFLMKETPRHKYLKNKIGEGLRHTEGVDMSSIAIDDRFIFEGKEKRRPDVYCKYKDKEIVFEIQISNLSLRYILSRHEFYKKKGIYLVWILDNLDIHAQSTMARDIKYLTTYENFFRLNEAGDTLSLQCEYKQPFLTLNNVLKSKWQTTNITLADLKFDTNLFEAFYFDYSLEKSRREQERQDREAAIKAEEERKIAEQRLNRAKFKARDIIRMIKERHDKHWPSYSDICDLLEEMTPFEINILNEQLKIDVDPAKRPAVIRWIANAGKGDFSFICFLLSTRQIRFEVNQNDSEGSSPLQEVYKNSNLWSKEYIVKFLFARGYTMKKADIDFLVSLNTIEASNDLVLYELYSRLHDPSLISVVSKHKNIFYILESAKRKSISGFNYKPHQWAAFAINAVQYYQGYWDYIECAFKVYGIWEIIIELDKKGTFRKKVEEVQQWQPEQKQDIQDVVEVLYPEIQDAHNLVTII